MATLLGRLIPWVPRSHFHVKKDTSCWGRPGSHVWSLENGVIWCHIVKVCWVSSPLRMVYSSARKSGWRNTSVVPKFFIFFKAQYWTDCIFLRFFWCGPFLKSLLNLFQFSFYCSYSVFLATRHVHHSSLTRDQTHTPCIGRQNLNHQTTREVPRLIFKHDQNLGAALKEIFTHPGYEKQCLLVFLLSAVSCAAPAIPENGGIDGSVFTYGNKVIYRWVSKINTAL